MSDEKILSDDYVAKQYVNALITVKNCKMYETISQSEWDYDVKVAFLAGISRRSDLLLLEPTLHLNLRKKWFDAILARIKKEEYRELSDYWKKRFKIAKKEEIQTITFSNGYAKNRRQFVIELVYIKIDTGLEVWGAVPDKNYIVSVLGDIIKKVNT